MVLRLLLLVLLPIEEPAQALHNHTARCCKGMPSCCVCFAFALCGIVYIWS